MKYILNTRRGEVEILSAVMQISGEELYGSNLNWKPHKGIYFVCTWHISATSRRHTCEITSHVKVERLGMLI